MLSAAGGSREHPAPEITPLLSLMVRFTKGKASGMPCRACPWPLVWPELGAGAGLSGGWRSTLPSAPSEAQFRFLD